MQKLKEITHVHIFESPSPKDRLADNKEGYALGEMLRLSGIDYQYYDIQDAASFSNSCDLLIDRVLNSPKELGAINLHISMHGNQDGVGLTSGDFISWELFSDELKKVRSKVPPLVMPHPVNLKVNPIIINFSSCDGFHGHKINQYSEEDETLFFHTLGPVGSVRWDDSLVAFTTFYHNVLSHNVIAKESVRRMNLAANLDNIFQISMGKKMMLL